MKEWKDQAIILRVGQFHEADLWLRMLCRDHGLVTVFAFGGAKSKKRFCGCLDLFNTLDCRIKSSRSGAYLNLEEAVLLKAPRLLRENWRRMGIAANCLRFLEALHMPEDSAKECFDLLENLRSFIETEPELCKTLPLFFRLRIVSLLGFAPDFQSCGMCGINFQGNGYFFTEEGQTYCPTCAEKLPPAMKRRGINTPLNSLVFLKDVQRSLPNVNREKVLTPMERRACAHIIDSFVEYHLGVIWHNDGFYQH